MAEKHQKKKKGSALKILLVVLLLLVLTVGAAGVFAYNEINGNGGKDVYKRQACVRILRRWAESIGYPRSFTIYDTDDAQRVMKAVYKDLNVDDKFFPCLLYTSRCV